MKKLDLGQTLGILANVGVLVGILLLVYELSQNRQMMQAQTRAAVSQSLIDASLTVASDDQLLEAYIKGVSGAELSGNELARFRMLAIAIFRFWENAHYQYRIGMYEEAEFDAQRVAWRKDLAEEGLAKRWCEVRPEFSPEFVDEMNKLLTTFPCQ